jgi:hypothetical protein
MSQTGLQAERLLFLPGASGDPAFWKPLADRLGHPAERALLAWHGVGLPRYADVRCEGSDW